MSERSWDDEDSGEVPPPIPPVKSLDDRWLGEDLDIVKDNWDDEEDEEKKSTQTQYTQNKKKSRMQLIAEKQEQKEAEMKAKREEIERMNATMTPAEKLAEKLRLQKIQEESDLRFAVDMMGIKEADTLPEVTSLADVDLASEAGLQALGGAVVRKIRATDRLEKKPHYVSFLESFCKDLCNNLEVDELKRVTASLNALYNEKVKANKPLKGKRKGAAKAKLHLGKESESVDDRYIDDVYDFM